ncbi:MAG: Alginate lyase [Phycisphaerales bacterium]|nr:Alginate lyase [Phycisphaerales bacterium]
MTVLTLPRVAMAGALTVALFSSVAAAQTADGKFVLLDESTLASIKGRMAEPDVKAAIDKLLASADEALTKPGPAVTEKTALPVGNDPHDYMSLAIYFWPNPKTPDGKPYVNRDGVVNRKEVDSFDAPRKDRLINSVRAMALAYHFTGDSKYADGAAGYLRKWFLDPNTRMNPNLNHGQFVPGVADGRGYGIIETRSFVQLVDAVTLLDGSPSWSAADMAGFKAWMSEFVDWLQTSKIGGDEAKADNNHGEWYDAQLCGLAKFVGKDDVVRRVASEEGARRIAKQMEPDGRLPRELTRTKSMHYSLFALDAWFQVARIAKTSGVDLYEYQSEDARSLRKGLEFMTPFMLGEQKWTYPSIDQESYSGYAGMFRRAAKVYNEPRFEAVAKKLRGDTTNVEALLND